MALVGLTLWFVLSVWEFAGDGYADYLLAVVSGFILIVVALTSALWWQWWRHRRPDAAREDDAAQEDHESLRTWAAGDLDTWQDRLKGANAAIEMLLPIAAVAFGMTAFGIVLHFTARGAI
jgi:type VI protein secretion system component VasK